MLLEPIPEHIYQVQPHESSIADLQLITSWLATFNSKWTRKNYAITIRDMLNFVQKPLLEIKLFDLQAYQQHLEQKYAHNSITCKLYTIKSLFTFLYEEEHMEKNVAKRIKPAPVIEEDVYNLALTKTEMEVVIALEPNERNKMLLRLFYHTGGRLEGVRILKWSDIKPDDAGGGTIRIVGKGMKIYDAPIQRECWQALQQLPRKGEYIFMSTHKKPLSRQRIQDIVALAGVRANLDRHLHPHMLRHTHGTIAAENGCDLAKLRDGLGHSNATTTNRYMHGRKKHGSSEHVRWI